jgi:hypothetical protein
MPPRNCPHCLSDQVRPSRRRAWEWLLFVVGVRPDRCLHCFERYYVVLNPLLRGLLLAKTAVDEAVDLIDPELRRERQRARREGPMVGSGN